MTLFTWFPPSEIDPLCSLLRWLLDRAAQRGGGYRSSQLNVTWLNLTFSHLLSVSLVSYSIDRRTDRGHLFNVYPMNGSVFLLKSLDRETTAWHNISVVATELSKSSRVWDCLHCSCDILIKSKTVRGEAVEHSLPWRGSTTRIRPRSIAHWMGWLEVKPQSLHIYK